MITACIVDDDQIYVYSFKKLLALKNINLRLFDFKSAADALSFLTNPDNKGKLPDVIFLDINMPVMDGWDFMEMFGEIKPQLGKPISVYMVSSSINTQDIRRAKSIPEVTDYIVKPMSAGTIVQLLSSPANQLN